MCMKINSLVSKERKSVVIVQGRQVNKVESRDTVIENYPPFRLYN